MKKSMYSLLTIFKGKFHLGISFRLGLTIAALTFCFGIVSGQVNTYTFATGTGAMLDPMTGSIMLLGVSNDDTPSPLANIGFDFIYNGMLYTQFSATPDGFLKLGSPATTSQFSNSITSTTNLPKIFPMWDDLATGTTGQVRYVLTGSAPNRILVIEWFVTIPRNTTGPANSTFQAWLYETTNVIEFRYGAGGNPPTASVGINSTSPVTFHSVTTTTHTSSTTTANNSNNTWPGDGRMYSFTPPPPPALDLGVTGLVSPVEGCFGNAENVTVSIRNFGSSNIDFSINNVTVTVNVTGAVTQTLMTTLTSGTLASGATQNVTVGVLNMSTVGTYTFNANTMVTGDGNASNNAMAVVTRTALAMTPVPYMEDFGTLTTLPTGWANVVSTWSVSSTHGQTGSGLYKNIYSSVTLAEVRTLAIGPLTTNYFLMFDTRVLNFSSYPNGGAPSGNWGSLDVLISTDCGGTYTLVASYSDMAGTAWLPKMIDLGAYSGQKIVIKFKGVWVSGDWYVDIDNIKVAQFFNWYLDGDTDGYGDPANSILAMTQPPGYVADNTDCDDTNPNVNPAATEVCNDIDDDCDGQIDEGVTTTYYADTDGDGFGDPNSSIQACAPPFGYTVDNSDCDDTNMNVNPIAIEVCNGIDDDCDGNIDEGFDQDFDGYTSCGGDCNDDNSNINPGVAEACNGIDDNCNGNVDEGFDLDNDGYTSCGGDCDDNNPDVNPDAAEACNGIDDNCNGQTDEGFSNFDGDGIADCVDPDDDNDGDPDVTDCNDNNPNIYNGAPEICNDTDDDCDGSLEGVLLTYYLDADGDGYGDPNNSIVACTPAGYVLDNTDCDDSNADINPGATEICNDTDDDCDGGVDEVCNLCSVTLPACKTVYVGYAPASYTTLTAQGEGGTGPYTYAWSNGANTQSTTVSPVITTTYIVTLTDAVGCTSTASTLVEAVNISCGGTGNNAKIYICHNNVTQCVLVRLVPGHLAHGDKLGQCNLVVCEPYQQNNSNNSNNGNNLASPGGSSQFDLFETEAQHVDVFPNPASEEVSFSIANSFDSGTVKLFDMQGRLLMFNRLDNENMQSRLKIGDIPAGTYMIHFVVDGENFVEKLIIE